MRLSVQISLVDPSIFNHTAKELYHEIFMGNEALKENTDVIQSIKLFQKVQSYVIDNADQTPNHSTIHGTGHDGGEFLFFPIS